MKVRLQASGSDLQIYYGKPPQIFKKLLKESKIKAVYCNHDYEPAARARDSRVAQLCANKGVDFVTFKDQVIFEKDEILTDAGKPYTVFTPYKRKWLATYRLNPAASYNFSFKKANWFRVSRGQSMPSLQDLGFKANKDFSFPVLKISEEMLTTYAKKRDYPALDGTSHLGLYLRFGTVSIREIVKKVATLSPVLLSELIWREFFMQILYHFPQVEKKSFRSEFDKVAWRKSATDFQKWCQGQTGYPLVDAGMRELNATGCMHNRVRMLTASFLTKHLLIHWRQGERYFAEKLLDFDLAANNGNWQWVAGTGCDAAPYFRIFNPQIQIEKFDPDYKYIKKWVPEWKSADYVKPMVEHSFARDRALRAFAKVKSKQNRQESRA